MRVPDQPLPGDLVIRCRDEHVAPFDRTIKVWIVSIWPDAEITTAGPYQSYRYAFDQATRLVRGASLFVWRDHARTGEPEELELVGIGSGAV